MRNGLSVLMGLAIAGAAASATADVITIKFNGTDGVTSSLRFPDHIWDGSGENGWSNFNHNTGSQQGTVLFSHPIEDWYYPITLFRANLSSIPAGSTINSVQFVLGNSWWNGQTWTGVEVREVNVPGAATWQPGNGDYTKRNTPLVQDLGAGQWFADLTTIDAAGVASGIAWDGTVKNMNDIRNNWGSTDPLNYSYVNTAAGALTTLLGSGNVDAGAGLNTFNGGASFTALVQGWLDGTTQNDGFALSAMNSQRTDGGNNATNVFSTLPDGAGLIIDYTPVPEPATLGLLATGCMLMLRRRPRTA